jgi:molecular chaperone HscA
MAKIGINLSTGSLQQEEIIVGIDLGTTNSLIAIIHPETKQAIVLKEHDQTALVPSIVHFSPSGDVSVGIEAKPFLMEDPANTVFSVKKLMGKSFKDLGQAGDFFSYQIIDDGSENLVKVEMNGKFYSPIELSAYILKALKSRAEHILKTPVNRAVVTVPAYFNDAQRQATRDAGRLAGLDVLRIVNEPTAASLAYGIGLNKEDEKTIAVYDLGGGTFDISILRIAGGIFEVLSTHGDTFLGGDDFDNLILNHWLNQDHGLESMMDDKSFVQQLRLTAEEAKKQLSALSHFSTSIGKKALTLSKKSFDELIDPLVSKTIHYCEKALKDAGIRIDEIDEIIMVGGSTRVALVKAKVSEFFKKKVHNELNPDEVVALGAAIQADILAGNNKDFLLLDITPLSLGIETMGGLMDVLIPRNSKIPTKTSRQYTTQKDGQSGIVISVYQGERDSVSDNRKLASFTLSGIPAMPAGLPKVEISFLINADGILVVNAKELRSGTEQRIEVKPQYGLTDAEVEQMLLDSIQNAKNDMQQRALVEAQTEANVMIETSINFIKKNGEHLSAEEVVMTNKAITELEKTVINGSKDEVQSGIKALNEVTKSFAERVMDIKIKEALVNKNIG